MNNNATIKESFLDAPDTQICAEIKLQMREEWNDTPSAVQILKTIDLMVYGGGASQFAVQALQILYEQALEVEQRTHFEVLGEAVWRKDFSTGDS